MFDLACLADGKAPPEGPGLAVGAGADGHPRQVIKTPFIPGIRSAFTCPVTTKGGDEKKAPREAGPVEPSSQKDGRGRALLNRSCGGNVGLSGSKTGAGVLVDCSGGEHRLPVFNKCL